MDAKKILENRSMGDLPTELREGEKIIIRAEISQSIYWRPIAIFALAIFFFTFAYQLGLFISAISAIMFVYFYLIKHFLFMAVSNQRLLLRAGLIKIDNVQIRLDRIESVEIQRTLMGQMLGYGTVVVTGTGSRLAFIPYISNAAQVRNAIDELLYTSDKKES